MPLELSIVDGKIKETGALQYPDPAAVKVEYTHEVYRV